MNIKKKIAGKWKEHTKVLFIIYIFLQDRSKEPKATKSNKWWLTNTKDKKETMKMSKLKDQLYQN